MPADDLGSANVAAVMRDLAALPDELAQGALAATALTLARELDNPKNRASAKSMCAKAQLDIMDRLRELAPPAEEKDELDEITARRRARLAAVGGSGTADLSRP